MPITIKDLDKGAKSMIRDIILNKLFKKYHSLPLPTEVDKIKGALTSDVLEQLEDTVEEYYVEFSEHSGLNIDINADDYVNIYLMRI